LRTFKSPRYALFLMQRLTARLLLLLIALGVFQPLVEALSAEPPHACCLRKLHSLPNRPAQVHDRGKAGGNCCPPLTTPHTANPVSLDRVQVSLTISRLKLVSQDRSLQSAFPARLFTRAPPSARS
jgi:hypothetical protein